MQFDVYLRELHIKVIRVDVDSRSAAAEKAAQAHYANPLAEGRDTWIQTGCDDWRIEEARKE